MEYFMHHGATIVTFDGHFVPLGRMIGFKAELLTSSTS